MVNSERLDIIALDNVLADTTRLLPGTLWVMLWKELEGPDVTYRGEGLFIRRRHIWKEWRYEAWGYLEIAVDTVVYVHNSCLKHWQFPQHLFTEMSSWLKC